MRYRQLGTSDLKVSEVCLGTMTFGQQNSLAESHALLDLAVDRGINFIDCAEMYPIPTRAATQGRSEEYIGRWLAGRRREQLVIASKIAGPGRKLEWIRGGPKAIDRENVRAAVDASLARLRTDYIDLYQIHWPDRYVPLFGETFYDPAKERPTVPIREQLEALAEVVRAGKVRYVGVSNETPWGVAEFIRAAEDAGLPRIASIQNPYGLVNRSFENGLAETVRHCRVGHLAHSPLAFGTLSGKYLEGDPPGARLTLFPGSGERYRRPQVKAAVRSYVEIARRHGLSPAVMALAFVRSRWFVSSVIIGATRPEQLEENLRATELELDAGILREIDEVHARCPSPAA